MGHVQDLWFKTTADEDAGLPVRVRTRLHGRGKRYRVRYLDPHGRERSKSFPDRRRRDADSFLTEVENDKRTGNYIGPKAGQVTFENYARTWLASQTFDESSREAVSSRLRKQVYPALGHRPLAAITPTHIRSWDRELQQQGLASSYRHVIFVHVQAILDAAIDDEEIRKNPCKAKSVRQPRIAARKVIPWSPQRVHAVHEALAERYRITLSLGAGLGLRQGETFGLAVDDVDIPGQVVHVVRQVKIVGGQRCFGPPKGGRARDVPLPQSVAAALSRHTERYPPLAVTLPWRSPAGPPTTAPLIVYGGDRTALQRQAFHSGVWQPALRQAGVIPPTTRGNGFHALRHFYASTLLDAGESIVALAEHLGHRDPAFTLRTYTHLLPSSQQRTRTAVDTALRSDPPTTPDGTHTA